MTELEQRIEAFTAFSGTLGQSGGQRAVGIRGPRRHRAAQLPCVVLSVAHLRSGSARQRVGRAAAARAAALCASGARHVVVQPRTADRASDVDPRVDGRRPGPCRVSLRGGGSVPQAGPRARPVRGTPALARVAPDRGAQGRLRSPLDGRREVPGRHPQHRRERGGELRPVSPRAGHEPGRGRSAGGVCRALRRVRRQPQHLRVDLQRRAAPRLVPGARARLRDDARRGALRQRHSARRGDDAHRRDPGRRGAVPQVPPPAAPGAGPRHLHARGRLRAARGPRRALQVRRRAGLDRAIDRAARPRVPGPRARGVRAPLDRRVREQGQTQRRVFGAGVRRAPVHAARTTTTRSTRCSRWRTRWATRCTRCWRTPRSRSCTRATRSSWPRCRPPSTRSCCSSSCSSGPRRPKNARCCCSMPSTASSARSTTRCSSPTTSSRRTAWWNTTSRSRPTA